MKIFLDDLFIKFGSDKGSLDGKTYSYIKLKDKNKFSNYLEWINRANLKDFDYQLGHNFTPVYERYFSKIRFQKLKIRNWLSKWSCCCKFFLLF